MSLYLDSFMGTQCSMLTAELVEDVFELIEACLTVQPFRCAYRALSESPPAFRVVHQHHRIRRRVERHHMHADRLALAHAGDFADCFTALFFEDAFDDRGGPRRCILLVDVMTFHQLCAVATLERRCGRL